MTGEETRGSKEGVEETDDKSTCERTGELARQTTATDDTPDAGNNRYNRRRRKGALAER